MKNQKFKKLEEEVKKKDFESGYNGVNNLMKALSVFGNLVSIFAASFFMMKLMSGIISSTIVVVIISFTLLISLELLKRTIFNKFSLEFIRSKYNIAKKEVAILMLFSIGIICASFYSSLNGAQEFADRNDQIENSISLDVNKYGDSLRVNIYSPKIEVIEEEIVEMKNDTRVKDDEMTKINTKIEERGYLTSSERGRIKDLKDEKEYNRTQIELKDEKVVALKAELESKINDYKSNVESSGAQVKETNKYNSLVFVIISTLIEFLILIGIFFGKYYSFTSYNDFKNKMDKDPRYQKWVLYSSIMEVIYMNDLSVGDKLPTQKDLLDFCKMSDIYLSRNELSEFFKLLNVLKIVNNKGPYKFINKEREDSDDILSQYFKI